MATRPTNFNLDNTLGALLIGLIVSTALFGLTTLQTYLYYANYRKDKVVIKWLVGLLWMLDFIHTLLISHSAYHYLVRQSANPAGLQRGEWSIISEVGVTTVVTVLVQFFFAHRVYKLSGKNWFLTGCIIILALGHTGLGTASTVRLFQIRVFSKIPEILDILSGTLIVMAVNDGLITIALCYYFKKTQTSITGPHDAIRLLILYTIETGLLTSVLVTIDAVCALAMPGNWIFIGIEFCLAKLYANSLLTILNSRRSVRRKFGDVADISWPTFERPITLTPVQMEENSTPGMQMFRHLQSPKKTQFDTSPA